jgi:hypothetical protein
MEDDSEYSRPPAKPKLSMTPSWVMLGFVLGALFVVALQPGEKTVAPSPPAPAAPPAPPTAPLPAPRLTTIEAVFADWGAFAVWDNDLTEVALWNTDQRGFTDFHEVRRVEGTFYFRTIPRLTRRIVNRGKPQPESCPLQFTETEEHYREWLEHGRTERRPQTRSVPPRPVSAALPAAPTIEAVVASPSSRVDRPAPDLVSPPLPKESAPQEGVRR